MPTDITPLSALLFIALGVLVGLGWHLAGVVVGAMQSAGRGVPICIILAVVIVIVAIAL